jgi:hypothetical protein
MSRFAGDVLNRRFRRAEPGKCAQHRWGRPAGDQVAAATGELDGAMRDVRAIMFSLAADP